MKWEEVNGRIIKNQKSGTGSLYSYLCTIFPDFFIHSFVKRKEAKSYEKDEKKFLWKIQTLLWHTSRFCWGLYLCCSKWGTEPHYFTLNIIGNRTILLCLPLCCGLESTLSVTSSYVSDHFGPQLFLWMSYFQRNQQMQPQLRCGLMALIISCYGFIG